jgi:hypothetical protein
MPQYRLYFIDPHPRHIREIAEFVGKDDDDALREAQGRSDGRAMELWREGQVIRSFPRSLADRS